MILRGRSGHPQITIIINNFNDTVVCHSFILGTKHRLFAMDRHFWVFRKKRSIISTTNWILDFIFFVCPRPDFQHTPIFPNHTSFTHDNILRMS